jgi:hypothetical protein
MHGRANLSSTAAVPAVPRSPAQAGLDRSHCEPKEIIMSHIPRIRRVAAGLAGLACAGLGLAITAPAAFAHVPPPGGWGMPAAYVREALLHGEDLAPVSGSGSVPSSAAATVTRTVVAGGMPGWQIALIAAGAALLAATLAVLADRARAAHGRVLTLQRCDDDRRVPPGGAPELGETPEDGVARDLLEQTGKRLRAKR